MEALEATVLSPRVKSSPSSSAALDTSGSAPPVQAANSLASWRSCGDVVVGAPVQPAGKSPWTRSSERAIALAAASLCVVGVEAVAEGEALLPLPAASLCVVVVEACVVVVVAG